MRQIQWVLFGVAMIAVAVFQNRRALAEDNWAGLPFFLIPVVLGVGGFVAFMSWWTGRKLHRVDHRQRSEPAQKANDCREASETDAGEKAADVAGNKATPLLSRPLVIYRRVRILATLLAIIPSALVAYNVTAEQRPSFRSYCNLTQLQNEINSHNLKVTQSKHAEERRRAQWLEVKDEMAQLSDAIKIARQNGQFTKALELQQELGQLELATGTGIYRLRQDPPGDFRDVASESRACVDKQRSYADAERDAIILGVVLLVAIPALVFALFIIAPFAFRWVAATDHKD
jgi:hypothetical protein